MAILNPRIWAAGSLSAALFFGFDSTAFAAGGSFTVDPNLNIAVDRAYQVYAGTVMSDGKIVIGGEFSLVDGIKRNSIARLHPNGEVDPAFDPGDGPTMGS